MSLGGRSHGGDKVGGRELSGPTETMTTVTFEKKEGGGSGRESHDGHVEQVSRLEEGLVTAHGRRRSRVADEGNGVAGDVQGLPAS